MSEHTLQNRSFGQKVYRFVDRYRMNTFVTLSAVIQLLVVIFWRNPEINFNKLDKLVDEVAFIDNVNIIEPVTETVDVDDGEIELTTKIEKKIKKKQPDPRISGAKDAMNIGATTPVDLSPNIKPPYTDEARAAGVTGTITLEVIIADTGEVLRVRSVGKKLGYGLEAAAIRSYRRKKFSPSMISGKPLTVKVFIPVRFTLK
ncbi:MAG: energy transducer TonB [Spirochaetota bacterium]